MKGGTMITRIWALTGRKAFKVKVRHECNTTMTDSALFSMHIISAQPDDVVRVYAIDGESEFYTVTFKVGATKRVHEITMSRSRVSDYITDLVAALSVDISPVLTVQFESCITPSIMVHVADLTNCHVLDLIDSTLENALMNVKRTA